MNRALRQTAAEDYLSERSGKLEYRFIRYAAVADELFAHGMDDTHVLVDVGAGMCDFDFYLRTVRGWKGRYVPVDASIDGCDLSTGLPKHILTADYMTAIELLEHVKSPLMLLEEMRDATRGVVVVTTPNTNVLGEAAVIEMDRTHISPLTINDLKAQACEVSTHGFFGVGSNDSLLGVTHGTGL